MAYEVSEHRPSVFGQPIRGGEFTVVSPDAARSRWGYRSVCTCGAESRRGVALSWTQAMFATLLHLQAARSIRLALASAEAVRVPLSQLLREPRRPSGA